MTTGAETTTALPTGKIGDMEVSRLILGGNLLTHYHHCRDQNYVYNLVANYNTHEKLLETFELAEACGINTMSVHTVDWTHDLLSKHRDRGGKLQWIFCPSEGDIDDPDLKTYKEEIAALAARGANACYVWGEHTDVLVRDGRTDVIARCLDIFRSHNMPAGVGAHDLAVIKAVEEAGFDPDFYVKTHHHHDYPTAPTPDQCVEAYTEVPGYWDRDPAATAEFMATVKKPWIAFKTMAAGTIQPESAFQYAYGNGADFIYAGMFDFDIAEDVEIATRVINDIGPDRARPWA